jgi:hypothetical protein
MSYLGRPRRGDVKLEGHGNPDANAGIIYFDGEELTRVERREDVAAALLEGACWD